ncbi:ESPR-type extended signal peptide-containing protein [Campylobacter portucalensis]|nr:ESPR-type extended signal peptide-containing protein [Campylobacter portucalensis]
MNKSFKTKYNIKTSQVKAVPEIAKNCQSSTTTGGVRAYLGHFHLRC